MENYLTLPNVLLSIKQVNQTHYEQTKSRHFNFSPRSSITCLDDVIEQQIPSLSLLCLFSLLRREQKQYYPQSLWSETNVAGCTGMHMKTWGCVPCSRLSVEFK